MRFIVFRSSLCVLGVLISLLFPGRVVLGQTLLLKDGRKLEGKYAELASMAGGSLSSKAPAGDVPLTPLVVVDDGLRRTYVHTLQIKQVLEDRTGRDVRINIWQPVAERGGGVGRIGQATRITPFDEFGRRTYEMQTADGPLAVVQGITQITPLYTKVEGLSGGPRSIVWDMRIATSSIPRDVLSKVLTAAVKPGDIEGRLQLVRLYLASERYRDASLELERILKEFPERQDLQQDISQLRQMGAKLIVKEIQLRASAGQHQLARKLLTQFPTEGVAGETLQQVRELLEKYTAEDARRGAVLKSLSAQVAQIADDNGRQLAESFVKEIAAEMNEDAVNRLTTFERLADDAAMKPEQKVALAMSGWLVGANQATDNFQVAVSLAHARDLILAYMREPLAQNRAKLAADLHDTEGASIERIAQLLRLMKPPQLVEKSAERGPRLYELAVNGLPGDSDSRYVVQLPPEYDPLRQYPTLVVLADAGVTPEQMIDYWAGPVDKERVGDRLGQATRYGYIVIAVEWRQPHQYSCEYSAREHHAVLGALRGASRRFSVDTDRVFLTGHGLGGDLAWDLAIAHPDVWAGVIPFLAVAEKFVTRYGENSPYVPWYFVAGELDGDKLLQNAVQLDRYMKPNNDVTVVEFLGRGYEPFGDEIQRLFDWMARRKRQMPKEIDCVTMRPWDNFYWWIEAEGLPAKSMVAPASWPPSTGTRPARIKGRRLATNKLTVTLQAEKVTVWLTPDLVDLGQPLVVEVNGRPISPRDRMVRPDVAILLEDARTRVDRQHPYWAKLSTK